MPSIEKLFTDSEYEKPVKIPVGPPGEAAIGSLSVIGRDSEAYRLAHAKEKRRLQMRLAELSEKALDAEEMETRRSKLEREATINAVASVIVDWDFDEPCTHENVKRLLEHNWELVERIDLIASDRELFFAFKRESSNSTSSES